MNLTNWYYVGKWLFVPKWHYFILNGRRVKDDKEDWLRTKKISKLYPGQIYGLIYIISLCRKIKWYWLADYIRSKLIGLGYNIEINYKNNKTTIHGFTWDKIGRMSLWYEI